MRLNGISAKEAAERARAGDNTAREMFRTFGGRLGAGLAVIIDILNPERIVIGGIGNNEEAIPLSAKGFGVL